MIGRRFKLEIDGTVFFCAAFESEAALDQALGAGGGTRPVDSPLHVTRSLYAEPRTRGRPCLDDTIADAVATLGPALDASQPLASRARLVQRHLAQGGTDPEMIPCRRTVETYLTDHTPHAQQIAKKMAQKIRRRLGSSRRRKHHAEDDS